MSDKWAESHDRGLWQSIRIQGLNILKTGPKPLSVGLLTYQALCPQ